MTELYGKTRPAGMFSGGFFDTDDGAIFIEREQPCADVDGRDFLNFAVVTNSKLAGAAADVDVQHNATNFS